MQGKTSVRQGRAEYVYVGQSCLSVFLGYLHNGVVYLLVGILCCGWYSVQGERV